MKYGVDGGSNLVELWRLLCKIVRGENKYVSSRCCLKWG